jgi:tRNA(fMet)-specific endonuclease VapC
MNFLLDTDICSAHLKRPSGLAHRFMQHSGGLAISTIVLAELYTWAYRRAKPQTVLDWVALDLLPNVTLLDFDQACAHEFGRVRGELLKNGVSVASTDLMIAAVALTHDLTLVTHNSGDYRNIPGLRLDDWLVP